MTKIIPLFLFLILMLTVAACQRNTVSGNNSRHELRGTVVSVEPERKQVTVAHEEVPNYMPAMTMAFPLRDDHAFEVLEAGDRIAASLVVDGTNYWLEELVVTKVTTDTAPIGTTGNVEAAAGTEVPNFSLINQDAKPIKIQNYRGKALLLTFIYTRCPVPDYCTLMSNNFASIEQALRNQEGLYDKTHLLSITVDPEYDTPAVLRSYGASHTGRYSEEAFKHWEFATGSREEVNAIAQFFGLQYYPAEGEIIHGLRTAIISPDGKVHKVYRGNEWKPDEVVKDLEALLSTKSH